MMDSECDEPMPGSSSEPVVDVDSGQDTSLQVVALCFIHCLCTTCVLKCCCAFYLLSMHEYNCRKKSIIVENQKQLKVMRTGE